MATERRARSVNGASSARGRARPSFAWLLLATSVCSCTGGPHPVPPLRDSQVPSIAPNGTATGSAAGPSGVTAGPNGAAGATFSDGNPSVPSTAVAGAPGLFPPPSSAGTSAAAAGSSASPAAGSGGAAGSATGMPGVPSDAGPCSGALSLLRGSAADSVLLVMDRSADMANAYEGEPRWQKSGQALLSAFRPLSGDAALKLGALFYPSSAASAPCLGPSWLCQSSAMPIAPTTCTVNAMGSSDQVDLQPVTQALGALSGPPELYQPIAGTGVPLRESIDRIGSLFAQPKAGRTVVILLASAAPSCSWDQNASSAELSALAQRGISTRVIALPGADAASMDALSALAKAAGQTAPLTPLDEDALQSELQSIALGSLSSCSLAIEPAVSQPAAAHLLAGVKGSERELPRMAADGSALWTISPDGSQLQLLGATCTALQHGDYDSLRIVVGCVKPPLAP